MAINYSEMLMGKQKTSVKRLALIVSNHLATHPMMMVVAVHHPARNLPLTIIYEAKSELSQPKQEADAQIEFIFQVGYTAARLM